jgi:RNA polymerase sigma-70 factor (sigma-E family)
MKAEAEREFRVFVAARSLALFRTAYLLTGETQAAKDLVQAALTELAARWSRVDQPEAYARRVMYHQQVDRWRLRRRHRETAVADVPDERSDRVDDPELRLTLQQALARLPRGQRAAVVLRFYEDLSESTVADLLGVSVGTVRSQTARAVKRLRDLCADLDVNHEGVQG